MEVYESAQYCGARQVGNPNNTARATWGDNPLIWAYTCPGSANWITIDVIGAVFNPSYPPVYWQGGYVARPTAAHDF